MIAASAKIHPLSVIEDGAVIGENVVVGPFCYVGPKVVLHDDVELLAHAVVTGRTVVGRGCRVFSNAVIGGDPQSLHHDGAETTLTVGEKCTFREGVTVNTGTTEGGALAKALEDGEFKLLTGDLDYGTAEEGHVPNKAAAVIELKGGKPTFVGWRKPESLPKP